MPAKKRHNPFYVLLIPVGIAFVVTSFAYYVMAFQAIGPRTAETATAQAHPLFLWLRANGATAMLAELAALAVLTIAALATDQLWDRAAPLDPTDDRPS